MKKGDRMCSDFAAETTFGEISDLCGQAFTALAKAGSKYPDEWTAAEFDCYTELMDGFIECFHLLSRAYEHLDNTIDSYRTASDLYNAQRECYAHAAKRYSEIANAVLAAAT